MGVKLPDAGDIAARPAVDRSPIYEDHSGEIGARALSNAADQLGSSIRAFAEHDDQFNYARAKSALLSNDQEMRAQLSEDDDWATQESRYNEGMARSAETAAKLIRGARSKALFEDAARMDIQRGALEVRAQAKVKEGEWGRSELDDVLQHNRVAALEAKDEPTRTQLISDSLAAIQGARGSNYINDEQAVNLRQRWTESYGDGYVDVQPTISAQLKMLRNPKGTPADFIDPAKRADKIRVLEDKLRVESDRREAKAQHMLGQFEEQISLGIPTTEHQQNDLRSTIAGTSVQGEFDDVMKTEKEVQDTLRMPMPDQQRYVQEKQAALLKNGGTLAEARNIARLNQAVTRNVALLQSSPLLFAEERLGAKNEPLDFTDIVDPAKRNDTQAAFQDRATALATVATKFKTNVPMQPLLPQEVKQFSDALDKASPRQAADIFSNLRQAAGSMDVFKGAVRQVTPDAPVKRFAGLLSAQQAELKVKGGWFSPDKTLLTQDVGATLLQGAALLGPSKAEKADDGKPATKQVYLPQDAQTALQMAFGKTVGNTFRSRPDAALDAYQAVQAYYVGRAAQLGLLAKDTTTIDTDLVKEAVRATQGNVVDYNSQGGVLPPWGMSANDFEARSDQKLGEALTALGLKPDLAGKFGLQNTATEGVYAITNGEGFLGYDKNGQPLAIDIRRTDPSEARGVIRRNP